MPSKKGVSIAAATFAAKYWGALPIFDEWINAPFKAYKDKINGVKAMRLNVGSCPRIINNKMKE